MKNKTTISVECDALDDIEFLMKRDGKGKCKKNYSTSKIGGHHNYLHI